MHRLIGFVRLTWVQISDSARENRQWQFTNVMPLPDRFSATKTMSENETSLIVVDLLTANSADV